MHKGALKISLSYTWSFASPRRTQSLSRNSGNLTPKKTDSSRSYANGLHHYQGVSRVSHLRLVNSAAAMCLVSGARRAQDS